MLRNLYHKLRALAASDRADRALAGVAFAEASFFPIPPDIMLIPMSATRPERVWRSAAIATFFSVLGGLMGYCIGAFFMDSIGKPLLDLYGYGEKLHLFNEAYAKWGLLIILIKGLTPIPFKLVTIASGLAKFDLLTFILASLLTRGVRFFLVSWLAAQFGPSIEPFIEKQLYWVTGAVAVVLIGGFVLAAQFA
ncbi:YqaA family protein [Candidatus Phycosocius spiralis]|uniref:Cytochrome b561 n=1 Tax=Candidatus Phycosocius spiralis TaxID=2815099 RepID=A0ABQ4PSW3_9PROT|nr:YqaA family protein [Candidatus Phycosocius spiralis]GIU66094.1 cytochrome b561 [Candidatus Phycosocius spiralis]